MRLKSDELAAGDLWVARQYSKKDQETVVRSQNAEDARRKLRGAQKAPILGSDYWLLRSFNLWVIVARGSHPFPSRTRKLSPSAPMVLHARVCGRVGRCPIKKKAPRKLGAFGFCGPPEALQEMRQGPIFFRLPSPRFDVTPLNHPGWSTISDERKGKADEQ